KLGPAFTAVKDVALGAFDALWKGIKGVWSNIGSAIASGINMAISAINVLISGINALSRILPGIDFHVTPLPKFGGGSSVTQGTLGNVRELASGGVVPYDLGARGGFKTNGPRAIVGEGSPSHPEFVIPTDPRFRGRSNSLLAQAANMLGVPGFAAGGIPNPLSGAKKVIGGVGDVVGGVAGAAKEALALLAKKAAEAAIAGARTAVNAAISQIGWDLIRNVTRGFSNSAFDAMTRLIPGAKNGALIKGTHGGSIVNVGEGGPGHDEAVIPLPNGFKNGLGSTNHFHGDLVFPNIKDGDDAEEFMRNLESLVA
ncbi:MAG: hypothetical protein WEC33_00280, partial [Dehalococcoidia bacterium]